MPKNTTVKKRQAKSAPNILLHTVRKDGKRFIPEDILEWEEGNKNTRLEILTSNNPFFSPFRALIIDKNGEILFQTAGKDFSDIKKQLKSKQKLIPAKMTIQGGTTYFNRLIWNNPSKNTIIRIKTKNGNWGQHKKKKKNYLYAEIITVHGATMAKFKATTKTAIKVAIRAHPLIPKGLRIKDNETYFNRIKQSNS